MCDDLKLLHQTLSEYHVACNVAMLELISGYNRLYYLHVTRKILKRPFTYLLRHRDKSYLESKFYANTIWWYDKQRSLDTLLSYICTAKHLVNHAEKNKYSPTYDAVVFFKDIQIINLHILLIAQHIVNFNRASIQYNKKNNNEK